MPVAHPAGLPIGWAAPNPARRTIGFAPPAQAAGDTARQLLRHAGEGHLLTVAPTGAGKARSGIIPALLTHPGPVLVVDLKGENYQVTARARRRMGHRVVALDPFRVLGGEGDRLNPMDLFGLAGDADQNAEWLAELLCGGRPLLSRDPFWELTAKGLLTGLIGLAWEHADPTRRHLGTALDLLHADDVDYAVAVQLDSHRFANRLARQELAGYLQHEADRCRPSVRSSAQAVVKCLGSEGVRAALSATSFDLSAWVRGDPLDVYLVFPPDKLDSHRAVLRLWLGTLLAALMRRSHLPARRTLLLLDEVAQLGPLPHLRVALTLLRGYGVQAWTFWQDLSQLRHLYPSDWETVLNNSGVVQVFGLTNGWAARAAAEVLDCPSGELLALPPTDQMILRPGHAAVRAGRVDYLSDALFAGLADPNPRYGPALVVGD